MAIIGVFAVCYLVAANVLLRTRLLRDAVSRGPDIELDYASAYSVWPGRVHFRGLTLQVQDLNIEFGVSIEAGVVSVSLHELPFKRFHADSLSAEGLSFRFRQKLEHTEVGQAWVAALPPIPGFPDPPLKLGIKPPPVPDAEYGLWQIAIDDVVAELRELWFLEYRYLGAGVARGSFVVQPARYFEVQPASLQLDRGQVVIGDATLVTHLGLNADCQSEHTDVREKEGKELFRSFSGSVHGEARGIELSALALYLPPDGRFRLDGNAELDLGLSVTGGRLDGQSAASLRVMEPTLVTPYGDLSGDLSSSWAVLPAGTLEWVTTSPALRADDTAKFKGPVLEAPRLELELDAVDLVAPATLKRIELEVAKIIVPGLGWANRALRATGTPIDLDGRLEGHARFSMQPPAGPSAQLQLRLVGGALASDGLSARLAGHVDVGLEPSREPGSRHSEGRLDVALDGVELSRDKERTKPFRATFRVPDLRVQVEPDSALSATCLIHAGPADSLLPVLLGSPVLEGLAASALDLKELDANLKLSFDPRALRLELQRAESGALTGKGYWQRPARGEPKGAVLLATEVANVGISFSGSDTQTSLLVADDWLDSPKPGAGHRGAKRAAAKRPAGKRPAAGTAQGSRERVRYRRSLRDGAR